VWRADILTDDITRIAAIWSSIAVFWEAVGESVAIGTGLNQYLMMFYGYIAVALVMTVGKDVAEKAVAQSANETYKLAVENAYVGTSAVAGIMLWHGKPDTSLVCWFGLAVTRSSRSTCGE